MANFEETLSMEQSEALKLIECPICLEVAYPPIYQCQNGHLLCFNCINKVTQCPTCRSTMPAVPIRNIIVEKLTENITTKNCPNSKFGCHIRFKHGDNIELHLQSCDYCSSDYCNRLGLGKLLGCTKIIRKQDISTHLQQEHMLDGLVVRNSHTEIIQEIDNILNTDSRKWLPVTFSVFNEHFFLVSELLKKCTGEFGAASWKCIVAAPKTVSSQFLAKITLFNPEKKLELKWKGPVLSIDEINEELNHFSIPFETLKLFNNAKYQNTEVVEWAIKVAISENSPLNLPSEKEIVQPLRTISYSGESSSGKYVVPGQRENQRLGISQSVCLQEGIERNRQTSRGTNANGDSEKANLDADSDRNWRRQLFGNNPTPLNRRPQKFRSFYSSVGSIPETVRDDVPPLPRTPSPAQTGNSRTMVSPRWNRFARLSVDEPRLGQKK